MQREALNGQYISTAAVGNDGNTIQLYEYYNIELVDPEGIEDYISNQDNFQAHTFTFDQVYDESASQEEIYSNTAHISV